MARQTRAQRRARRADSTASQSGGSSQRSRPQPVAVQQAPARAEAAELRVPGGRVRRFVSESWAELQKVEWPGQSQLIQGVVVVLVACIVVGLYLYANDQVWRRFVENVLLR